MSGNRVFDDPNHVVDQPTTKTKSKIPPPWPLSLLGFVSSKMNDSLQYELDKLSENISCDAYSIFSLFFTEEVLQMLVVDFDPCGMPSSESRTQGRHNPG